MKNRFAFEYVQLLTKHNKGQYTGFTLIELLVVIIIIGILSAIALPSFLNQAAKARASEARTNVGAVNRAQQAYYLENQQFVGIASGVPTELGLGTQNTANYTYASTLNGTTGVFNYGTPAAGKNDLKAYVGGVFKTTDASNNTTTASVLCEALTPGVTAAAAPTNATTCVAATTKKLN